MIVTAQEVVFVDAVNLIFIASYAKVLKSNMMSSLDKPD